MSIVKRIALFAIVFSFVFSPLAFADSFWTPFTDTVNSGIINTKISMSNSFPNTNIDATVTDGVAIFSGEVNSKAQMDELIRIANSVSGIKGVDTKNLKIRTNNENIVKKPSQGTKK